MKLDYNFIKQILLTMEENNKHEIPLNSLLKNLKILTIDGKIDENLIDKFIGHVKILGDNFFIECSNEEYGFMETCDGYAVITNANYRITAQGYEFLDILKKDNILKQIADLAVPTAFKIGTQLLTQALLEKIKSIQ